MFDDELLMIDGAFAERRFLTVPGVPIVNNLLDDEAPPPEVAFIIGGFFSLISIYMWTKRFQRLRKAYTEDSKKKLEGVDLIRAMISCAVQNDSPSYSVARFTGESFLLLGGFQLYYKTTFVVMSGIYLFFAFGEYFCVLLTVSKFDSLQKAINENKERDITLTKLTPKNVYQDFSLNLAITTMVFVTQFTLIFFVLTDIYYSKEIIGMKYEITTEGDMKGKILDNGSLRAWLFYVLGTIMACVFLVGPKTGFGQSEGSPVYWIHVFLAAKNTGATIRWSDPVKDHKHERFLSRRGFRVWLRFIMTFVINGYGFHMLLHALPLQVSSQTTLTGIVAKAIGVMYLVDLDDSVGKESTITEKDTEGTEEKKGDVKAEEDEVEKVPQSKPFSAETQKVIDDAMERVRKEIMTELGAEPGRRSDTKAYGLFLSSEVSKRSLKTLDAKDEDVGDVGEVA